MRRCSLFVTGVSRAEALEEALEAGANDYVPKPVDTEEFRVRLSIAERSLRDLRGRKEREANLLHEALFDRLTNLPNLPSLLDRVEHSARRSSRDESYRFAVLVVDLWDFAEINRDHGRAVGDSLLKGVAQRLEEAVRSVDSVSRVTADRFAILLDGLSDVSDPSRVAVRIHQGLSASFELADEGIRMSACIGIALSAGGYEGAEAMLRDAQGALDEAKAEGPGTYRMHDPVMHAKAVARVQLETRIRTGLEQDAMELYQPIVRLETGRIAGFETLIRWRDKERGWVPAEEFIPIAEGGDLILRIGAWVLDRAVAQLAAWRELMSGEVPLFLSVNVSGRQFSELDLSERIADRLDRAEVPRSELHLEITETSLMERVEVAARVLSSLKERGISVQVDDFGTGYSSLAYLCRFPIDVLKIDRSFVSHMHHTPESREVVRTIVRLAHNLGMSVIAEGVETEGQLAVLREMECDLAQGYLFSRPVSAEEIPGLMGDPVLA